MSLSNLGHAALMQRAYERARGYCQKALAFARELGRANRELIPTIFLNLGLASLGRGDYERATASFEEALTISQNIGKTPTSIEILEGMACLAGATSKDTPAAILWGAAKVAREVTGIALSPGEWTLHEPYLAAARSRLGEEGWGEALAEGRAMLLEEATGYVLHKETDRPKASVPKDELSAGEPTGELTRREQEVVVLVSRGLTNRRISAELSISERTAGNHVGSILRKLGLSSRAQIATWATEHELLAFRPD